MEKIKNIFRPGHDKDDHTLYDTPEHKGHSSETPAQLTTDAGAEKKSGSGGVMSQILNPSGDKYDETRYGTTAHADKPLSDATTGTPSKGLSETPGQLTTNPNAEQKQGSVMGQVLNPHGAKYDEERFGTTAHSDKPLSEPMTGTPSQGPAGTPQLNRSHDTSDSSMSLKSGIVGPYAGKADKCMTDDGLAGGATHQSLPDRTPTGSGPTGQSNLGRDAALGGTAATGVGAAGYEAGKYSSDPSSTSTSQPTAGSQTERAFPLGGGSTTHSATNPTSTSQSADAYNGTGATQQPSTTAASNEPEAALAGGAGAGALGAGALAHEAVKPRDTTAETAHYPTNTLDSTVDSDLPSSTTGADSHLGRDAAIGGAGAAGAGALGYGAAVHHDDEKPVEGYVHHTKGPHSLDIANKLDPHVPGDFPDANGEDLHSHGAGLAGAGSGAAGLAEREAGQSGMPTSSTTGAFDGARDQEPSVPQTSQSQPEHHVGRDTALAGGAGAAGLGAYEATKSHENTAPESSASFPHDSSISNIVDPRTQSSEKPVGSSTSEQYQSDMPNKMPSEFPATSSSVPEPEKEHHAGRNAALGGGAGAAGLGAYEASKDHGNTGALSSEKPINSSTTEPYQSATPDKIPSDLPATSSSVPEPEKEHHAGRDAALAGGAGAAGLGAYEATKDHGKTGPASSTVGPHDSNVANVVDPRVQAPTERVKEAAAPTTSSKPTTSQTSPSAKTTEPAAEKSHAGRDAALAGGAGAAGLGAYEASKPTQAQTQPAEAGHEQPHKTSLIDKIRYMGKSDGPGHEAQVQPSSSAYPDTARNASVTSRYPDPPRNASVDTMGTPRSSSIHGPDAHERQRHAYLEDQRALEETQPEHGLTKHEKDRHEGLARERELQESTGGLINKHELDHHAHMEELRHDKEVKSASRAGSVVGDTSRAGSVTGLAEDGHEQPQKTSLMDKIRYIGKSEGS